MFFGIAAGVGNGACILVDSRTCTRPDIILVAGGSEVHLALEAREYLANEGIYARVISMPSAELFSRQPKLYRESVLPRSKPLVAIEAGVSLGWRSYVGDGIAMIGVDTYGASAPGPEFMQHFGFAVENVCEQVHALLEANVPTDALR